MRTADPRRRLNQRSTLGRAAKFMPARLFVSSSLIASLLASTPAACQRCHLWLSASFLVVHTAHTRPGSTRFIRLQPRFLRIPSRPPIPPYSAQCRAVPHPGLSEIVVPHTSCGTRPFLRTSAAHTIGTRRLQLNASPHLTHPRRAGTNTRSISIVKLCRVPSPCFQDPRYVITIVRATA